MSTAPAFPKYPMPMGAQQPTEKFTTQSPTGPLVNGIVPHTLNQQQQESRFYDGKINGWKNTTCPQNGPLSLQKSNHPSTSDGYFIVNGPQVSPNSATSSFSTPALPVGVAGPNSAAKVRPEHSQTSFGSGRAAAFSHGTHMPNQNAHAGSAPVPHASMQQLQTTHIPHQVSSLNHGAAHNYPQTSSPVHLNHTNSMNAPVWATQQAAVRPHSQSDIRSLVQSPLQGGHAPLQGGVARHMQPSGPTMQSHSPQWPQQHAPAQPPPLHPHQQQWQQPQGQGFQQHNSNLPPPMGAMPDLSMPQQHQLSEGRVLNLLQERSLPPVLGNDPPSVVLPPLFPHDAKCDSSVFRCTLSAVPKSAELLKKARLPLGLLLHPFKDLKQLSVLQASVIVRCKSCRTYINPYVQFPDQRHWKCNICYRTNELPDEFFFDPVSKTYGDPQRRPEIKHTTVEFIAPNEYMIRPPQPPVYLFVFDVSAHAIDCGYLDEACRLISENLSKLPGDERLRIGFITFDVAVYFFLFTEGASHPRQFTVSDVEEMFIPFDESLLTELMANKEAVANFLNELPELVKGNRETRSCLGAALNAAKDLMAKIGGRITVFQCVLPNYGPGALEAREDPNERASKEVKHLNPASDFYKHLCLECQGAQVAVDLFLLSSHYVDLATLSGASKFCGGNIYYYPGFHVLKGGLEVARFEEDFHRYLTRKIGFEAVLRIRCSQGLSLHTFHGNAFVRSIDLLSLPNINPDAAFGVQLQVDEPIDARTVSFQSALLYTSSKGDRRIRVHTLCLPVATGLNEIFAKADAQAIVALLSRMAVDRSLTSSLGDAREAMVNSCVDAIHAFGTTMTSAQRSSALPVPFSLRHFPLYILSLLKHPAFAHGKSVRLDTRVYWMCDFKTMPLYYTMLQLCPNLYALHTIRFDDSDNDSAPEPDLLQLSYEKIDRHGVYLMDVGYYLYIFVGQSTSDQFCERIFNVRSFAQIDEDTLDLPKLDTPESRCLQRFLQKLTTSRPFGAPIITIKEGSSRSSLFSSKLVEDRTEASFAYLEFLQHILKELGPSR